MQSASGDSSLDILIFEGDRRPVHSMGEPIHPEITPRLDSLFARAAARDTLAVTGPLFEHENRAHFWSVAAVRSGGVTRGYVTHLRRVRTTPNASRSLNTLIGVDNQVLFANTGDARTRWAALDGTMLSGPELITEEHGYLRYLRDGESYIAARNAITGTPLSVVVETPYANTQVRAHQFLRRTGIIGLLLLIAGA